MQLQMQLTPRSGQRQGSYCCVGVSRSQYSHILQIKKLWRIISSRKRIKWAKRANWQLQGNGQNWQVLSASRSRNSRNKLVHQGREMAKTSTSRERKGKNEYIKGEKWQYWTGQNSSYRVKLTAKAILRWRSFSSSAAFSSSLRTRSMFFLVRTCQLKVRSKVEVTFRFIPPQQPNISCFIKFLISDIVFVTD